MGPRSFSKNYKRWKHNYKRFWNSRSEVNGPSSIFEKLQTIKALLQTILKLDVGLKWLHVDFRRTTNEINWTTNNFKRFRSSSLDANVSSFIFEELQAIKAQLQTILNLDLGVKWHRVCFGQLQTKKSNYKQLQTISKLELGGK